MVAEDEKKVDENEEAEGAEGEEGEEGEGSKSKSKLLIIIAIAVVLIAGAGGAAFFLMSGAEEAKKAEEEAAAAAAATAAPQVFFYEMPEILVNLASTGNANRYLKLKINLEVGDEADLAGLESLMPRVVDDFQVYLRQLRVEDLSGSSGIYRLKESLLLRANQATNPLKVNNVLFKEILVQ